MRTDKNWGKISTRVFQAHQFFCKFVLGFFFPKTPVIFILSIAESYTLENVFLNKEEKGYYCFKLEAKTSVNLDILYCIC